MGFASVSLARIYQSSMASCIIQKLADISSTTLIVGDKDDGKTPCWSPATLMYCPEVNFNGIFQGFARGCWPTICSWTRSTTCRTPGTLVTGIFVICVEDSVTNLGPGFHWPRGSSEWCLITTKPDHVPIAALRGRGSAAQGGLVDGRVSRPVPHGAGSLAALARPEPRA